MHPLTAALYRAPLLRGRSLALRGPLPRLSLIPFRAVATSVTGRPASQTIGHAALNVKEEVGNTAADLARSIAGNPLVIDTATPAGKDSTFASITSSIASSVPKPYLLVGLAGGLPYVAASGTTVYLAHQAGLAASGTITSIDPGVAHTLLEQALHVQVTYGAVMLSFLGALHWGMEFAGYGGQKGYIRLALGVVPALFAWPTLALQPMNALIAQWVGFTGLWWADHRVTGLGWAPKWFAQYRFYLSLLVGSCIIGTLASTSYWGPVAGHGFLSRDLEMIREARRTVEESQPRKLSIGDVEAIPAPEDADHYVIIRKKSTDGEGDTDSKADSE